ncbi:MAG: thermonuclease family protein [Pirellulales bacterium]|nr:thermonuclease family protein [Pirellulales bacterium]
MLRANRLIVLLVIAVVVVASRWWEGRDKPDAPESLAEGDYRVERVVDGDTLYLKNGAKIRLIGADTPETVMKNHPVEPWGPEATEFTKNFVRHGTVRLQFDRERKDRYGRFLAHVWVDDELLSEELIRAGLARAVTKYPYSRSMKTRFRRAEDEAREARRGIWSEP